MSQSHTILIVDDKPANLKVITDALKACGYKTPVATSGIAALERVHRIHPDLILLDVVIPGELDGFQVCRRLKADEATKDIPIIFMTVLSDLKHKIQGFLEGAVDYVTKPIQHEELLARVSTHLQMRDLTRSLQEQTLELANANTRIQVLNEQLKAENIQVSADLRRSERMAYIGKITTSLSHELRNPLSAIKMTLQILRRNRQLGENDQHRIEVATKELVRLEDILKQLLDFAKPLQLTRSECRIPHLFRECLELLGDKFESKRLSVMHSFEPQLPPIFADEQKLTQVFVNLLLNAFEVSDSESTVRISGHAQNNGAQAGIEVSIKDQGPGIPRNEIQEIFEPFFTTKPQGTGLGLANVKQIVEAHGGWVTAENRVPRGACFRIWLPAGSDNREDASS